MILCLHGSVNLPLILCIDSVPIPKWWLDGSHAMHPSTLGMKVPLIFVQSMAVFVPDCNLRSHTV
jgi:hypothetical protein